MFPLPSFRVFGMELEENYIILMDIVPVDQFRYKFQGASWTIAGRADPEPSQKAFVHPDSPCSGSLWMAKPVSFNRLKLTNHTAEKQGYVSWNKTCLHYYHCFELNFNCGVDNVGGSESGDGDNDNDGGDGDCDDNDAGREEELRQCHRVHK